MSQRLSARMSLSSDCRFVVDLVLARQLLVEVLREDLDVAGLVHHLRRRVVLGVDPRHGLDDARGAQQRALLAVEELREQRVLHLDADLAPLLLAEVLDRRVLDLLQRAEPHRRAAGELGRDLLRVDVGRPVEVGGDVPLRRLRLLVQLARARAGCARSPR